MSDLLACPACGSDKIAKVSELRTNQLTLGGTFLSLECLYECGACGEKCDFGNENDAVFKRAQQEALQRLVPILIEDLENRNISMARFERAFELPQRTLTRWKAGDFSASSVALLRVIRTFPFIVDVAENGFNSGYAVKSLCVEAASNTL